jgi:hypothetical protein
MSKRTLLLSLEESTVEVLRAMAIRRGCVWKRGTGAPERRGNISEFLTVLAQEDRKQAVGS